MSDEWAVCELPQKGCRELKHRRRMCDIAPEIVWFGLLAEVRVPPALVR